MLFFFLLKATIFNIPITQLFLAVLLIHVDVFFCQIVGVGLDILYGSFLKILYKIMVPSYIFYLYLMGFSLIV